MTLWTVARQAPLSMGFPSQEYWSGLPFCSPEDLPNLEIEPRFPALQADSSLSEPPEKPSVFDIYCQIFFGLSCISLHLVICNLFPQSLDQSLCYQSLKFFVKLLSRK